MKLSSDASVLRFTHEGITNFTFLSDLDINIVESLIIVYKNSISAIEPDSTNSIVAIASVSGASVSSISLSRPIIALNAGKNYGSISRSMNPQNMEHVSFLATFKIEHESHLSVKDNDESKVPKINDRDNNLKIICWCITWTINLCPS